MNNQFVYLVLVSFPHLNMSKDLLLSIQNIKSTVQSTTEQAHLSDAERVKALEKELDQLNSINQTMDNVISSIDASSYNINIVLSTTESTNNLLDLWIKILSQTSYTNSLLNDKNWKGLTKNEGDYNSQLKKYEELNKRYNAEKQRKEQDKEAARAKKVAQEKRLREREEALRRRVYGGSSSRSRSGTTSSSRGRGGK